MKNLVKIIVILVFVLGFFGISNAQKFGHIDSNVLLELMPEKDSAQTQLKQHADILQKRLVSMRQELETKYQSYMVQAEQDIDPLLKKSLEEEFLWISSFKSVNIWGGAKSDIYSTSWEVDLEWSNILEYQEILSSLADTQAELNENTGLLNQELFDQASAYDALTEWSTTT